MRRHTSGARWVVIGRNSGHPLMRIQGRSLLRPRWGRQALPMTAWCPARGESAAVSGGAFEYGLRWTLVVGWGSEAQEPWFLLTDGAGAAWAGWWYGHRSWIEQGFRWLKRGGFGWRRCRLGRAVGVSWYWLVCALGLAQAGEACSGQRLGDRRRCRARVFLRGMWRCVLGAWGLVEVLLERGERRVQAGGASGVGLIGKGIPKMGSAFPQVNSSDVPLPALGSGCNELLWLTSHEVEGSNPHPPLGQVQLVERGSLLPRVQKALYAVHTVPRAARSRVPCKGT